MEGRKYSFRELEETELPLDKSHLLLETVDGSFLKHCFLEKKVRDVLIVQLKRIICFISMVLLLFFIRVSVV